MVYGFGALLIARDAVGGLYRQLSRPQRISTAVLGISVVHHNRGFRGLQQPLGGVQGQASDIEITAREIQKLKNELYTIIADHSHTPFEKVWADSDRDYWMTAQEAKEYGMIDQVLIRK